MRALCSTLDEFYEVLDDIELNENGCKIWPSEPRTLSTQSYHSVKISGKHTVVHRLALERKLGRSIKPGYYALHHCDVKSCVNEDHLYEGTGKNNAEDRWSRNQKNQEHRTKISQTMKQYWKDHPEQRAKASRRIKQYWVNHPEHRTKVSQRIKQYWVNHPEHRTKVSQAVKQHWAEKKKEEK